MAASWTASTVAGGEVVRDARSVAGPSLRCGGLDVERAGLECPPLGVAGGRVWVARRGDGCGLAALGVGCGVGWIVTMTGAAFGGGPVPWGAVTA